MNAIQTLTVGIMPLQDDVWSRGKCAYKLLLYAACGIPVVASPAGMNEELLRSGEIGCAARDDSDWVDAIVCFLRDDGLARRAGEAGRRMVEERFSIPKIAPKIAEVLRQAARG